MISLPCQLSQIGTDSIVGNDPCCGVGEEGLEEEASSILGFSSMHGNKIGVVSPEAPEKPGRCGEHSTPVCET